MRQRNLPRANKLNSIATNNHRANRQHLMCNHQRKSRRSTTTSNCFNPIILFAPTILKKLLSIRHEISARETTMAFSTKNRSIGDRLRRDR